MYSCFQFPMVNRFVSGALPIGQSRRVAKLLEPRGPGSKTADGSVGAATELDRRGKEPFERIPKTNRVQHGIQKVGDGAIVAVLWVCVMPRMMFRGLQEPDVLQKRDDASVFLARAMRPFVEFVRVRGEDGKQPDLPRQQVQAPRYDDEDCRRQEKVPRTLPPIVARHVAWKM